MLQADNKKLLSLKSDSDELPNRFFFIVSGVPEKRETPRHMDKVNRFFYVFLGYLFYILTYI